jgi:ABC-type sugar transport system ATPase subunit
MMIGRNLSDVFVRAPRDSGPVALRAVGLSTAAVGPVDFSVRRGEVVGLAGLVGSGRSRVVRALAGVDRVTAGSLEVGGQQRRLRSVNDSLRAGIGVCPQDRKALALIPGAQYRREHRAGPAAYSARSRGPSLRPGDRGQYMRELSIRPADPTRRVRTLSGGNQQKVVLARWLARRPKVLVLDEPTRGVDVGAKAEIYALITHSPRRGWLYSSRRPSSSR